jgi:RimJ/RimL family protein N-acetyltransferase
MTRRITFSSVYYGDTSIVEWAAKFLYEMLGERDPLLAISHEKMPTYEEHLDFVKGRPYKAWYIIKEGEDLIGNIYLSKHNEIGIFLKAKARGQGVGSWAVEQLMKLHGPDRYFANIHPRNEASIAFFRDHLGFKTLTQLTYKIDTREPKGD